MQKCIMGKRWVFGCVQGARCEMDMRWAEDKRSTVQKRRRAEDHRAHAGIKEGRWAEPKPDHAGSTQETPP